MKKIIIGLLLIIIIGLGIFYYDNPSKKEENKLQIDHQIKDTLISDKKIQESIFKDYYQQARKLVDKMTIEEKIGQLFLVRYDVGDVEYLSNYYPGGYILFAKDFEKNTKESIKKELEKAQEKNKYSLILGVDEEGGYVTRISRFPAFRNEKFLSPRYYYEKGGYELLEQTEKEKAELLKEIGINLNLAPVADVSENENDFINNRTFGRNAEETATLIKQMVRYANDNKINACLKHFPGYGNNEDTHTGIAIDNRPYDNFIENDFKPFMAGIEEKVPSILVSHNIVKSMDESLPASLSEKVIKELRDTLKFTGIIITDDLAMDAVKSYVENNEAATLAINAGNDMIITSDFINMYKEVLNSYQEGNITEETINRAVLRIIAWKYSSNLLK